MVIWKDGEDRQESRPELLRAMRPEKGKPKKKKKDTRNQGLTRWPSNQEHLLLLQRTWVRFPEPPWWLKNFYYSSSRGSNALFWILWAPGIYVVHIHTCRQTLLHVK